FRPRWGPLAVRPLPGPATRPQPVPRVRDETRSPRPTVAVPGDHDLRQRKPVLRREADHPHGLRRGRLNREVAVGKTGVFAEGDGPRFTVRESPGHDQHHRVGWRVGVGVDTDLLLQHAFLAQPRIHAGRPHIGVQPGTPVEVRVPVVAAVHLDVVRPGYLAVVPGQLLNATAHRGVQLVQHDGEVYVGELFGRFGSAAHVPGSP